MKTDLRLVFPGTCRSAFAFYETVFGTKVGYTMTYGQKPPDEGPPVPEEAKDLVMHSAMPLGSLTLMGCDAFPGMKGVSMGGFNLSVSLEDEAEVRRIFAALSEGGSVQMPPQTTFWTPLFGMCTDKFNVEWMVSVPGPEVE